jgi:microcystin-dependent protein
MALESASFPNQLVAANPSGSDRVHQGDDHIRLIKTVLKNTFPNLTGAVALDQGKINDVYSHVVPYGVIAYWYGIEADVPAGWAICDGRMVPGPNGGPSIPTPNMQGRAGVGVGAGFERYQVYGQATQDLSTANGGYHAHSAGSSSTGSHSHSGNTGATALSVAQMPAHQHGNGIVDDNADGIMWRGTQPASGATKGVSTSGGANIEGITESKGAGQAHSHAISVDGSHSHDINVGGSGDHTHDIAPFSVIQPSLALHFIMKII